MKARTINGDLRIGKEGYIFKGFLYVNGTIIMDGGELVVEGKLMVRSEDNREISIVDGGIYARSISTNLDICIKNGNIVTLKDLICGNIYSDNGDVVVGGDTSVKNVYCRNYLVDGCNYSHIIEGTDSVYVMGSSYSRDIKAPEVFLGDGGDFDGGCITAKHFEFDGHIKNCLRRYLL